VLLPAHTISPKQATSAAAAAAALLPVGKLREIFIQA
jgi:hypothetical protein